MKISIGNDHAGPDYKIAIVNYLQSKGYEILNHGYKTIYLGESVPTESLKDLKKHFDNIVYLCYSTVEPTKSEINPYVKELQTEIMDDSSQLWLIGRMIEFVEPKLVSEKTLTFSSIKELVEFI